MVRGRHRLLAPCNSPRETWRRKLPGWTGLDRKGEAVEEFAAAQGSEGEGAAIEVLEEPLSFEGECEKGRTQGAAHVEAAFAPIEAGAGEAAAEIAHGGEIETERLEGL